MLQLELSFWSDLDSDVKIGVNQEVEVFVRPRSNTGVVLLVWGGGDYLGIELDDGKVKVNINNGGGDIEAAVDVPDICDGQWRKITGRCRAAICWPLFMVDEYQNSFVTIRISPTSPTYLYLQSFK